MSSCALETLASVAGLFLLLISGSAEFSRGLKHLQTLLNSRPRLQYLAYPLGTLLVLAAAALIVHTLINFAGLRFSYD